MHLRLLPGTLTVVLLCASEAAAVPMSCEDGKAKLKDANEMVRANAVAALASCPDGVQQLAALLSDPKQDAIAVVNTLGRMGPPAAEALPVLARALQRTGVVSLYAAGAIVTIDPSRAREVAPTWLRFLDDKDSYNVAVALEQLSNTGLADLVPLRKATRLSRSKDEQVRMHAISILEAKAHQPDVEKLAEAALRRCKRTTRDCYFEEGSACQYAADFDADGKVDVAVLVRRETRKAVAVIARNACHLWWLPAGQEGGGWHLGADERGGATRFELGAPDGSVWIVSLRKGKLRGEQQDTQ